MAKTKPIGVRFDLEILETMYRNLNLQTPQQVVNYLMENGHVFYEKKVEIKEIIKPDVLKIAKVSKKEISNEYNFEVEKWFVIDKYTKHNKKDRPITKAEQITWDSDKSISDAKIKNDWSLFQKSNI